jgi:hypothetical protein
MLQQCLGPSIGQEEIPSSPSELNIHPDVLTTAPFLPDLIEADFLEPCQLLDYGCRIYREGMQ